MAEPIKFDADAIARRTAARLIGLNFPLMESKNFVTSLTVLIQDNMAETPVLIDAMNTLHDELAQVLKNTGVLRV